MEVILPLHTDTVASSTALVTLSKRSENPKTCPHVVVCFLCSEAVKRTFSVEERNRYLTEPILVRTAMRVVGWTCIRRGPTADRPVTTDLDNYKWTSPSRLALKKRWIAQQGSKENQLPPVQSFSSKPTTVNTVGSKPSPIPLPSIPDLNSWQNMLHHVPRLEKPHDLHKKQGAIQLVKPGGHAISLRNVDPSTSKPSSASSSSHGHCPSSHLADVRLTQINATTSPCLETSRTLRSAIKPEAFSLDKATQTDPPSNLGEPIQTLNRSENGETPPSDRSGVASEAPMEDVIMEGDCPLPEPSIALTREEFLHMMAAERRAREDTERERDLRLLQHFSCQSLALRTDCKQIIEQIAKDLRQAMRPSVAQRKKHKRDEIEKKKAYNDKGQPSKRKTAPQSEPPASSSKRSKLARRACPLRQS
ncbi:hypothetical protein P389DRAFT_187754 [Cystobasidium minutum MCA 4210]|uniref:uncharacterized protein n=1 Tax=Cystobasidium minutum MCA 4210 TaxID=1397322 RepID=UPI0034CED9B0|eukprot:jgi/Rhomi1/187754/estExt_fgenesh1_pg.C_1_t30123